jgi:hypothetical protein
MVANSFVQCMVARSPFLPNLGKNTPNDQKQDCRISFTSKAGENTTNDKNKQGCQISFPSKAGGKYTKRQKAGLPVLLSFQSWKKYNK